MRRGPGRPKGSTAAIRRERLLQVRMTDIEHNDFMQTCKELGVIPSNVVRAFTEMFSAGEVNFSVVDGAGRIDQSRQRVPQQPTLFPEGDPAPGDHDKVARTA